MTQMTHEDVSALLRSYAEDGLGKDQRARVQDHLGSCAECRAELGVVTALMAAPARPMDDLERAALHQAVRTEIALAQAPRMQRWGRRLAPALGAAAILAVIAVGIVSLDRDAIQPGRQVEAPAGTTNDEQAEEQQLDDGEDGTTATSQAAADSAGGSGGGSAGTTSSGKAARNSGSVPAAGGALQGSQLDSELNRDRAGVTIVRRSFASARFDPGNLVAIAGDLAAGPSAESDAGSDTQALYATGRAGPWRATVARCIERTVSASPLELTATSATVYRHEDIVVITFVWVDDSRALNYEVRGWRNRDCDRPSPIYRRGRVP